MEMEKYGVKMGKMMWLVGKIHRKRHGCQNKKFLVNYKVDFGGKNHGRLKNDLDRPKY
jgi:hypothetical protein